MTTVSGTIFTEGQTAGKRNAGLKPDVSQVLDRDQLRVLVVAGAPSWDYQLVERLLSRDKALATSFWLQSREGRRGSGTPRLEELPATPEALNWYDVVLLLDPDPESLGPDWGSLLRGFAEQHAGGILYMPGPRFATHWISSPDTAGIREILPVSWPDAESIEAVELLDSHSRGWPARVVAAEADHPLLRDNDGAAAFTPSWDQSSTVFWSFPVAAVRPTARVVLEHGDPATRLAGGNRPL